MNKAALETLIRNDVLSVISTALEAKFDTDVLDVSASELTIPVVDAEGNEKFALIKVSIPRGTRINGSYQPYDGYAAHEDWELTKQERADTKREREERHAREEAEKERKRKAKHIVKELNEKGFNAMVHEPDTETEI